MIKTKKKKNTDPNGITIQSDATITTEMRMDQTIKHRLEAKVLQNELDHHNRNNLHNTKIQISNIQTKKKVKPCDIANLE